MPAAGRLARPQGQGRRCDERVERPTRAQIGTDQEAQRQQEAADHRAAEEAAGVAAAAEGSSRDSSDAEHPSADQDAPAQADPTLDKPLETM